MVSSLLTAVASDTLIGKKHDSNTELIAQGILNTLLGLWGFIPGAGVTTRTMANIESGARTPIATLFHSLLLLASLVFLLPLMRMIPMVTLAAMLMMASYGMCEWRVFSKLMKAPKGDVLVLLLTFFLTVAVELSVAILVGVLLSAVIFLRRMSDQMQVTDEGKIVKDLPEAISVFEVNGPLFFGDTDKFLDSITFKEGCKVVIVRLRHVSLMDSTAFQAFQLLYDRCRHYQVQLVLSETTDGPYHAMKKMDVIQQLGKANVCRDFEEAVDRARFLLKADTNFG
jgi:SulP family sulfate permease